MTEMDALPAAVLPAGIRARCIDGVNGLRFHFLETGWDGSRPAVLLLHGFPELAYSWRKIMLPLAAAGYHVIAPDQRGYGRTTGWDPSYDGDLAPFRMFNLVRDVMGLLAALGIPRAAVVGHDFGSSVAAWCGVLRPDLFPTVTMMSAPIPGPPALPEAAAPAPNRDIHADLAALPRPRKHYQRYYSTREANDDMTEAPQGLPAFLRGYYHVKSADWAENRPHRLAGWTAAALAEMPTYYIMDQADGMAATVVPHMPGGASAWLSEDELAVYAGEYARTGFQGGLQWYRCRTSGRFAAEEQLMAGRTIDVPSQFLAGTSDWGVFQVPGSYEQMQQRFCPRMLDCQLIPGAGHWVQQEQPDAVTAALLSFLAEAGWR